MTGALHLDILGTPAPQGSKKAYVVGGRARLTESGTGHKAWRTDIVEQTRTQLPAGWTPIDVPAYVHVTFRQAPPKSLTRAARAMPPDRGHDIDKLVRALLDGLTVAGVWNDDRRVVELYAAKVWAIEHLPPGAWVRVQPLCPGGDAA